MRIILSFCIAFLLFVSCSEKAVSTIRAERGFYYWHSSWRPNYHDSILSETGVKHMYMHMFDVDWDEEYKMPVPVSALEYSGQLGNLYDIESVIPVVFITNETFKHIGDSASEYLAQQIYQKLRIIFYTSEQNRLREAETENYEEWEYSSSDDPYRIHEPTIGAKKVYNLDSMVDAHMSKFREIQFDCDWTPSTKNKYFKFLKACEKRFEGKTISATIRLYPYKYQQEMGVPPVDRGMLMCYNIGNITDPEGINSIFDLEEIRKYIGDEINYPLPLDYALPVFSWAALYHEKKLVNVLDEDIIGDSEFFRLSKKQPADTSVLYYDVIKEYSRAEFVFHPGDLIKVENVKYNELIALAAELRRKNRNKQPRLILYHFDSEELSKNQTDVQSIFNAF